ncbi:T9SS type A sorting domain-containing protein [bacterium]|nr:T9SS type A sorting domain-containing protein [bacterium]
MIQTALGKLFLSIALVFTICFSLSASVLYVPSSFPTIQEAIHSSSTTLDDTILVEPGIYYESLTIDHKTLTIASRFIIDGDTSWIRQTAIDGDGSYRALEILGNGDQRVKLIGLTVQNAYVDTNLQLTGGGIYSFKTNIIIDECHFFGNTAFNGSVVFLDSATVIVQRSIIAQNYANPHLFNFLVRSDSILVEESVFSQNTGTGLRVLGCGTVRNNSFQDNSSLTNGGGLGVSGDSWTVMENQFINNQAYLGGGLAITNVDSILIANNRFIQNEAIDEPGVVSGSGGAILLLLGRHTSIVNNYFTQNISPEAAAIFAGGSATIVNNAFLDNRGKFSGLISVQPVNSSSGHVVLRRNFIGGNSIDPSIPSPTECGTLFGVQSPCSLTIEEVDFIQNTGPVIQYPSAGLHLQGNYWGDASGPFHPQNNPEGLGDTVLVWLPTYVEPWSTEHFWAANVEPDTNCLDFGMVEIGDDVTLPLVLTNTGVETLVVRGGLWEDVSFSFELGADSLVLASEETATVQVRFTPQDDQPHLDSLRFDCNDPAPIPEAIELRGNVSAATPDLPDQGSLPATFKVTAPYPNPFNPSTRFQVELPRPGLLRVEVFDLLGRRVVSLHEGRATADVHNFTFDGSSYPSGLYFIRATTPTDGDRIQKVMLVK